MSLGYTIDPNKLRIQIGAIEIICGLLLLIGPRIAKVLSSLVLASTTIGALYVHYILDDPLEKLACFAIILLMVFVRLNLLMFSSPRNLSESNVPSSPDGAQVSDFRGKSMKQSKKQQ